MEKRLILAIILSVLVIAGYQYTMTKIYPPHKILEKQPISYVKPAEIKKPDTVAAPKISPQLEVAEEKTKVITKRYIVTLSNIGGSVSDLELNDYKLNGGPLVLAKIALPDERIFAIDGINYINNSKFELERNGLSINYRLRTEKFEIIKKYNFSNDNYGIELEIILKNFQNEPLFIPYGLIGGSNIEFESKFDERYISLSAKINDKISSFKNKKNQVTFKDGNATWAALSNRYFSMILKPLDSNLGIFSKTSVSNNSLIGIRTGGLEIPPGKEISNKFFFYAGPNEEGTIKALGKGLEDSINYGFFGGISKWLLWALRLLHKIIPNWGIALILLAIAVSVILYPLSITSYKSMKKLQILQPHMDKLRKEHKENPQRLQKEMMELYKKHKVNPMGGCLPLLLQMPIFFALYNALSKSIELRGSKFLWIRDLSLPDAVKLPLSLPLIGDSINILPILMALAMFLQQKLTAAVSAAQTEEQIQQQKLMMFLMPVIFCVILYNFPSGLVLYWLTNTVVTVIQQKAIMRSV